MCGGRVCLTGIGKFPQRALVSALLLIVALSGANVLEGRTWYLALNGQLAPYYGVLHVGLLLLYPWWQSRLTKGWSRVCLLALSLLVAADVRDFAPFYFAPASVSAVCDSPIGVDLMQVALPGGERALRQALLEPNAIVLAAGVGAIPEISGVHRVVARTSAADFAALFSSTLEPTIVSDDFGESGIATLLGKVMLSNGAELRLGVLSVAQPLSADAYYSAYLASRRLAGAFRHQPGPGVLSVALGSAPASYIYARLLKAGKFSDLAWGQGYPYSGKFLNLPLSVSTSQLLAHGEIRMHRFSRVWEGDRAATSVRVDICGGPSPRAPAG